MWNNPKGLNLTVGSRGDKVSKGESEHSGKEHIDSELIGIVYEVAFDPNFWTDLLQAISGLFENRDSIEQQLAILSVEELESLQFYSDQLGKAEAERLSILLPHLYRALKLKREYNDTDHSLGQARAIMDQFPFGVLQVNDAGKILSANQHALDTIEQSSGICLKDNVLCSDQKDQDHQLKQQIYQAANTPYEEAGEHVSLFKTDMEYSSSPVSLLITPDLYPVNRYDRQLENCAIIFIAAASVRQTINAAPLQALFDLTPAEARLAALLVSGLDLNQAAEKSFISRNTAKVQLKSIFSKTGVRRQAELVKLILTSPTIFHSAKNKSQQSRADKAGKFKSAINIEAGIQLRDGRNLQYAEYGDPRGQPVLYIHGILGCRYERLPDDAVTRQAGIRLITVDRPGFGLSDFSAENGYLEFADDLLELLDHLNIKKVSILGLSVGAIYACAFAYKNPQRIKRIAMVSATPPFRSFADFEGIPASLKLLIAFSIYLPSVARMISEIAVKNACKNPLKFFSNIPVGRSDRIILTNSELAQHLQDCLLAGSDKNYQGFVHDIMLSAEPWPFAPEDISIKIDFWHGTDDTHSPLNRIRPVIEAVPNKQLHTIEEGGHFLIYAHWWKILQSLV